MIMIDTTVCIDYLDGNQDIKSTFSKLNDIVSISSISIYEISIGLEKTKRKISVKRHQDLYKKWIEFLNNIQILSLDSIAAEKAAQIYDNLEANGLRIDDNDCLIAGIMQANGISRVLTKNADHFNRIAGFTVLNY